MITHNPLHRSGQAGFPHPALRSVVLPPRGLTSQRMGSRQGEQAQPGKEGIRPTKVIRTVFSSLSSLASAQQATQPHPHSLVQGGEREAMTVLEVFKPAPQGPVQVRDDRLQALAVGTPSLGPNRVLELVQALRAGPTISPFEVIAQKVKAAALRGVYDPRLDGVQDRESFSRFSSKWRSNSFTVT